ncbi:MAG: hypothetical protein LBT96_02805, partial [Campylobacteraceae bacterium]|nr:hypothetical protein [Campylobacteraceae bacterium]
MYELLSTYIDFGIFLFIGKYLLAFFVVGIIVLIFCKKLKLFKRQNKILDKLTYLNYLYIPTIFIAFSITYASAAYVKKETVALINEAAPAINAQATAYL